MAKTVKFEGNAQRSEHRARYDLIPNVILEGIANRFAIGAKKFGENNWKEGGPEFFKETINHLVKHLWSYIEQDNSEDDLIANLEAVLWNAGALLWWEKVGKARYVQRLSTKTGRRS